MILFLCCAHIYFSPPPQAGGKDILGVLGRNSRGSGDAPMPRAPGSPCGDQAAGARFCLGLRFSFCSSSEIRSKSCWRSFPTPRCSGNVSLVLPQGRAIPVGLFHKAKMWSNWRCTKRTLSPSFSAHSSLDQIRFFCGDSGFSWEVQVSLVSARWFLLSCIKSENRVQASFIFFLEKNWK